MDKDILPGDYVKIKDTAGSDFFLGVIVEASPPDGHVCLHLVRDSNIFTFAFNKAEVVKLDLDDAEDQIFIAKELLSPPIF